MKSILVIVFLAIVSALPARSQPVRRSDADLKTATEKVDILFAPWSKASTPGAAVVVIKDGKILVKKGYGLANLDSGRAITPDTAFLLASVTKQFTAMAIMMLAERGELHYEDTLSQFFPEFPMYAKQVTIRHLLNHLAGFPEYDDLFVESGKIDKDWPRSSRSKRSSFEPTAKDALAILAQVPQLRFSPGEKFEYSNSGYVILAQIVEKISGKRFSRFLNDEIFKPLRMNRSVLYDETRPEVKNVATSYSLKGGVYKDIDYTPQNAIYGEDNIYSTVEDLYKWDQALYTEKLVKRSSLRSAFTPGKLNNGTPTAYGFGWRIRDLLGVNEVSHTGSWLGFRNCIIRFPDQHFTVIVLSNLSQFDPARIAVKIAKIYLAGKMTFPRAIALAPGLIEEYVGRYEFAPGVIAEATNENGSLWLKVPGGEKLRLIAESKDAFFADGAEELTITFQRDEFGHIKGFGTPGGNSARRLDK
jgi:CubicO group peptidase (beta-lactamase class C family)